MSKFIAMIATNLVTLKAATKLELLLNKCASNNSLFKIQVRLNQNNEVWANSKQHLLQI